MPEDMTDDEGELWIWLWENYCSATANNTITLLRDAGFVAVAKPKEKNDEWHGKSFQICHGSG